VKTHHHRFVAALAIALAVAAAACSPKTPIDNAMGEYSDQDWADALSQLERAELSYTNGKLGPEYELKYLAYRGLAHWRLAKANDDKKERRHARPLVRRALDRWSAVPEAKAEGWLDPKIVEELEEVARQLDASQQGAAATREEAEK
jgi:hypothetical protein